MRAGILPLFASLFAVLAALYLAAKRPALIAGAASKQGSKFSLVLFAFAFATLALAGCERPEVPAHQRVEGGDPDEGRKLVTRYGCPACHTIPGIRGARGTVGPPLIDFGLRVFIAGKLPNRPDNLLLWLQDPPGVEPGTAMPNLGISEAEARHIAAYLYILR